MPANPPSAFVGREAELGRLGAALADAGHGGAPAVVVEGESGAGKTRLLREFAAVAAAQGATVLSGRCVDCGDAGPPFWPFVEALRPLAAGTAGTAGGSARIAAGTAGGRTSYFEEVLDRLTDAARSFSVALLLDDLHWADRSTRDLLGFLLANLAGGPSPLLVMTVRTEALGPGHPLLAFLSELRRGRRAEFLPLDRLDRDEVRTQLASILSEPPEPELLEEIWRRSEGNPFFVEEILAAAVSGHDLTSTLQPILAARLGVLSPEARAVASAVATSVGPVGHELLTEIAGLPEPALLAGLRECVDHHILVVLTDPEEGRQTAPAGANAGRRAGTYTFRHSLLRDAAYAGLLPGDAVRLHAAYGRALLAADAAGLPAVAWHFYAAGDAEAGLPAALAAAGAAEEARGYAEAHIQYERALELAARLPAEVLDSAGGAARLDRVGLAERAAEMALLAGVPGRAVELLEAAMSAAAPDALSRLHLGLGRARWAAGDSDGALEDYDESIRQLADRASAEGVRAIAAAAEARMLAGRYGESRTLAEEAGGLARQLGLAAEEAEILGTLAVDRALLGDAESAVTALEQAVGAAERATTPATGGATAPRPLARALLNQAEVLSGPLNRLDLAAAVAAAGLERLRGMGLGPSYAAGLAAVLVNTLFRAGRWNEADPVIEAALSERPTGAVAIELLLARARLEVGRGRFDAARADLERVDRRWTQAVAPRYQAPRLTLEAGLALWEGRTADARRAVARALDIAEGSDDVWLVAAVLWHGLRAEGDRAERARALGDGREGRAAADAAAGLLARAGTLHERAAPAVRPVVAAYEALCLGEALRAAGGNEERTAEAWADAVKRWDDLEQPYPAAYARFREAGARLGRQARSARAATALRAAHEVAVRLGAEPFRNEIEALAGRARLALPTGERERSPAGGAPAAPPSPTPGPFDTLTARELDVLDLMTEGRTNRQIATALFISEKTASVHVSHILAKLGVRSRVQAVAMAHQRPRGRN